MHAAVPVHIQLQSDLVLVPAMPQFQWAAHQAANQKFGEVLLRNYCAGDVVWVQDYHLMLLPAILKSRMPKMKARAALTHALARKWLTKVFVHGTPGVCKRSSLALFAPECRRKENPVILKINFPHTLKSCSKGVQHVGCLQAANSQLAGCLQSYHMYACRQAQAALGGSCQSG